MFASTNLVFELGIVLWILVYRKYYGTRFALKLTALMLAGMVLAALLVDLVFSAAGLIPETRPSIESITDRGIHSTTPPSSTSSSPSPAPRCCC